MLHQDHITFAMLLAKISLKGITRYTQELSTVTFSDQDFSDTSNYGVILPSEPSYDSEFQHFLRGKEIVLTGMTLPKVKGLSSDQSEAMVRLSRLPAFSDLVNKVEADEVSVTAPSATVTYDLINNLHGTFLNVFLISFFPPAILHVD